MLRVNYVLSLYRVTVTVTTGNTHCMCIHCMAEMLHNKKNILVGSWALRILIFGCIFSLNCVLEDGLAKRVRKLHEKNYSNLSCDLRWFRRCLFLLSV